MKKLTNKEREVMELFWQHGPMFVRGLSRPQTVWLYLSVSRADF